MEQQSFMNAMVNGLPGNMATKVAEHILSNGKPISLFPMAFTGPEITKANVSVGSGTQIRLVSPAKREESMGELKELIENDNLIAVDFSHPKAVNENASFYCKYKLPFVMGTTGGDRQELMKTVQDSSTVAVIAPNMAKQIVGFQAMMEYAANNFPGLFSDYTLRIKESHQQGKADTSGTAKALVKYFNQLGIPFSVDEIEMIRDPKIQQAELGVPEEHLKGHGWHTYQMTSKDNTVCFEFTHNVNGRDIYAQGTLDAILFLAKKIKEGAKGQVFSMIDVLKET
jgi:4-hydroxy-tetrahydrodipicolinate reductase